MKSEKIRSYRVLFHEKLQTIQIFLLLLLFKSVHLEIFPTKPYRTFVVENVSSKILTLSISLAKCTGVAI